MAFAVAHWTSSGIAQYSLFLALFSGSALLKGRLPGITGTYSPVFFFVLLGSCMLSFSEVVFATGLAAAVQCTLLVQRHPSPVQIAFNVSNLMISSASAFAFIRGQVPGISQEPLLVLLILGAAVYYFVNTALVSVVLTFVDSKPLREVWRHWCVGSLPYYLTGALIAGFALTAENPVTPWTVVLICPSLLLATICYRYWLNFNLRAR